MLTMKEIEAAAKEAVALFVNRLRESGFAVVPVPQSAMNQRKRISKRLIKLPDGEWYVITRAGRAEVSWQRCPEPYYVSKKARKAAQATS